MPVVLIIELQCVKQVRCITLIASVTLLIKVLVTHLFIGVDQECLLCALLATLHSCSQYYLGVSITSLRKVIH